MLTEAEDPLPICRRFEALLRANVSFSFRYCEGTGQVQEGKSSTVPSTLDKEADGMIRSHSTSTTECPSDHFHDYRGICTSSQAVFSVEKCVKNVQLTHVLVCYGIYTISNLSLSLFLVITIGSNTIHQHTRDSGTTKGTRGKAKWMFSRKNAARVLFLRVQSLVRSLRHKR